MSLILYKLSVERRQINVNTEPIVVIGIKLILKIFKYWQNLINKTLKHHHLKSMELTLVAIRLI